MNKKHMKIEMLTNNQRKRKRLNKKKWNKNLDYK